MRKQFIILTIALACVSARGAEPKLGPLFTYTTPGDVTVYTTVDDERVREIMTRLEQFKLLLEKSLSHRKMDVTGIPTNVFILNSSEWRGFLQPREGIQGVFMPRRFANYLAIDADADRDAAEQVIFHEFVHYFMRAELGMAFPPWFAEGAAELYSNFNYRNESADIGIPMQRVLDARSSPWIPFDRLLAIDIDSPEYQEHRLAAGFYGQAWLVVHYGLIEDHAFGKKIEVYLHELNQQAPVDAAAKKAFGDLAAVDKTLREYLNRPTFKESRMRIGAAPRLVLNERRKIGKADSLAKVSEVMFALNSPSSRIEPVADALEKLEPGAPRSALIRIRLADQAGDDQKFENGVDVLLPKLKKSDWVSRREVATLLLDRATRALFNGDRSGGSIDAMERAYRLFEEALTHNPEDAQSLWGAGTTATFLRRDFPLAEQRIKAAWMQMPMNEMMGVSLALVYGTQDRPRSMIEVLRDLLRIASDKSVRKWITETLIEAEMLVLEEDLAKSGKPTAVKSQPAKPRAQ
jgi:hypothetical protein